jgi:hypothetical protein
MHAREDTQPPRGAFGSMDSPVMWAVRVIGHLSRPVWWLRALWKRATGTDGKQPARRRASGVELAQLLLAQASCTKSTKARVKGASRLPHRASLKVCLEPHPSLTRVGRRNGRN